MERTRRVVLVLIGTLIGGGVFAMDFKPPGMAERLRAIGSTDGLPEMLRRAFTPDDDFPPIPAPNASDWLAIHRESGQTADDFVRSDPNRPTGKRNKIYFQPIGEFPAETSPPVDTLKEFAAAYFAMPVEVLPAITLKDQKITTRINRWSGKPQVLAGDVMDLLKAKLPDDAFCLLGITMEDLYPAASWNFVFGQASLRERVGVYSFVRYDPAFFGNRRGEGFQNLILRRSCSVLAHETAHMFGLEHCIYFLCLENGSNHLSESDSRPMRLCPVCLRKLQFSIGFDVVARYRKLLEFYKKVGFDDEAAWTEKQIEKITAGLPKAE